MKTHRSIAVILGVLSIAPLLYIVIFAGFVLPRLNSVGAPRGISPDSYATLFKLTFLLHVLTAIVTVALVLLYIGMVHRSPGLSRSARIVWDALLLVGGVLVIPVFWYAHVWRSQDKPPPAAPK